MAEEEFGRNLMEQVLELWINLRLERRQEAGSLPGGFVLTKAQIIMNLNADAPEVRFNDEVRATALARSARPIDEGEPVTEDDLSNIEDIQLTDEDPNAGHFTMLAFKGRWLLAFDFRYNAARVAGTIDSAREFLDVASFALGQNHLRAFVANMFSATELLAKPFNRAEGLARNHIKPVLGRVKLGDLSPAHLRGLYAAKLGSGLSGRTVGYIHVTLHSALKAAVLDGLIPSNPASAVKPPRMDQREMTPLSPAQARVLLDTARAMDDRWSALSVLAVSTGLRQGELLGLLWEEVNLESATLRVRHTLQPPGFPKGAPARLTPPKTRRSLRSVRLPHSAVQALLRHQELQDAERARSNGSWRNRGLVFSNTLGGYADYTNLVPRHFKPLLKKAGLPNIRFHDLRHTCATLLLTRGVHPKIVSEMLGHSSVSITLDVYSHVIPGLGDAAALAIEDVLGK